VRLVRHAHVEVGALVQRPWHLLAADDDEDVAGRRRRPARGRVAEAGRLADLPFHVLNPLAVHREVDDDPVEPAGDRLLIVAQFDGEGAAEPVGNLPDGLRRLAGVAGEDNPVRAERPRRESHVRRHAVVASRPVAVAEDDDLACVVHATRWGTDSGVAFDATARPPTAAASVLIRTCGSN